MKSNIKFFFWGILAAAGALVLEILLSIIFPSMINPALETQLSSTLIVLVLVEEILAFIFVWKMAAQASEKNLIFPQAMLIGLGFSAAEIIQNAALYPYLSSFLLSVYAGLLLVHTVTALVYGYTFMLRGISITKTWPAFLIGIVIHFLFNAAIIGNVNYWLLDGILLIFGVFLCLRYLKTKSLSK
ncbi:MAG: hypothetical protein P4L62_01280 [Candidatus Pacebacteria bacterium]|nr:hypothetical protein [Candidatus Paceibacterota bacterium]MDR3582976.1 hypothetical protein [Candidatus Paceibacterota bacterium]